MRAALLRIALTVTAVLGGPVAGAQAYVYWSAGALSPPSIARAANDGSAVNEHFLSSGFYTPGPIAVDGSHIYWGNTNSQTGTVEIGRANLDGSDADLSWIPNLDGSTSAITIDGGYLYWIDGNNIARANLSDGSGVNQDFISTSYGITGLAAASGTIYIIDDTLLMSVPESGGTPHTLVTLDALATYFGLTVTGGYAYWTALNLPLAQKPYGSIGRTPIGDPAAVDRNFIVGPTYPGAIATDGTYLYWTDFGEHAVGRAAISDPSNPTLNFISETNGLAAVAVDAGIDPTTTSVSCQQPTVAVGATITCTAKVGDSASTSVPGGSAEFDAGSNAVVVGSNPCALTVIGGVQQCTVGIEPTIAGNVTVHAAYGGDALHHPSSGHATVCAGTALQCNPPPPKPACVVPRLKGKTLAKTRAALTTAHCELGKVKKPLHVRARDKLVVGSTNPKAGTTLANGAKVAVRLVVKRR
jgi:hypothetical protein